MIAIGTIFNKFYNSLVKLVHANYKIMQTIKDTCLKERKKNDIRKGSFYQASMYFVRDS